MKLELKDIRKSFGEKEILHGVSFAVESGRALGLLGRNGAGKTTTIRIIMDVFHANSGEIMLDGEIFHPTDICRRNGGFTRRRKYVTRWCILLCSVA